VPQRADYHPEIDTGVHLLMVLDMAARLGASLAVRYACLGHDLGKAETPAEILPKHIRHEERSVALVRSMSERLKVDNACRALAELTAREHGNVHRSGEFGAAALVRLLERCDALRRPDRFAELLLACECDARGRLGLEERPYAPKARLAEALRRVQAVDATAVARPPSRAARAGRRSAGRSTRRASPPCAIFDALSRNRERERS
jgi:tRNA nucleotidyltransferase (CCA-adding enzyme)